LTRSDGGCSRRRRGIASSSGAGDGSVIVEADSGRGRALLFEGDVLESVGDGGRRSGDGVDGRSGARCRLWGCFLRLDIGESNLESGRGLRSWLRRSDV
jgi:hypothetical protein